MKDLPVVFLVVIYCLTANSLTAQRLWRIGDVDSLRSVLTQEPTPRQRAAVYDALSEAYYTDGKTDSAFYFSDRLMEVAQEIQSDTLLGKAYRALSIVSIKGGQADRSIAYADSALYYFTRTNDLGMQLIILGNLSYQLANLGDCVGAVAAGKRSDSLQATMELPLAKRIRFRNTYCAALTTCKLYDLIPELAKEYLPDARSLNDKYLEANLTSRLIISYRGLGELDSALVYANKMATLLPHLNSATFTSSYYTNVASIYFDLGDRERARELLQLGLEFAKRNSSPFSVNVKSLNLGIIEMEDSNYQRSIDLLEGPLEFFRSAKRLDALSELYPALSKAYAGVGRYQEAYQLNEQAFVLRDSLNKVAYDNSLAETVALNEAERARRELDISNLELAQQKAVNQSRLRLGGILLVSLLSLFGISFFVIRARRQSKDLLYRQQQAELRYNLLRAQMNPHFIFNSLNAIQSFFSGQRFERGNEYLGTFSQLVRRILEQTGQSSISLEEELDTLRLYLELEQLRMGSKLEYTIHVASEVETELLDVPPLVLQPFVENAIWHGIAPKNAAGRIDISVAYDEHQDALRCIVQDDGLGMQPRTKDTAEHRSRGVEITRRRLGQGGKIDIRNRADEEPGHTGVRTELVIPLWD